MANAQDFCPCLTAPVGTYQPVTFHKVRNVAVSVQQMNCAPVGTNLLVTLLRATSSESYSPVTAPQ